MRVVVSLLVAAAVVVAWVVLRDEEPGAEGQGGGRPPIAVTDFTVQPQTFSEQVAALGTLQAWESVDISASVSQIVTAIGFEDGQTVAAGDMLALLKQDSEQATLRELQATLTDAQREVKRLQNLASKNQVAQTELDRARTEEEITRYRIEEVESRIADRTIVAPFAGTLGLRQVSEGALVTPGERLTTLDDLHKMRLEFSLPATMLGFLQEGQAIVATSASFEQNFSGTVSAIDSRIDPVSRSILARATLDNSSGLLRPGLLMEVTLNGPEREVLLVPEESLQSRSLSHFVWRIANGVAHRVEVAIGGRKPGWVVIDSGLEAGDRVVRDGVGKLSGDSATVSVAGA